MTGNAKIKNYLKYNRFELAEKLGIEIPKPKQKAPLMKIPFRRVRIMTDETSEHVASRKRNRQIKNIFFNCKNF